MIIEYFRPSRMDDALERLAQNDIPAVPLAGGTSLTLAKTPPVVAIDLQALGLDVIEARGNYLEMGAMVTLQTLFEIDELPAAFHQAIEHEAAFNQRQVMTVAGAIVAAGGRSPFVTALLAMDPVLVIRTAGETAALQPSLGEVLPFRDEILKGKLITQVILPLNVRLAYQYVARTPADRPIVCAAVGRWPSGRTRVALGGFGGAPILAFDGTETEGAEMAAASAYSSAGDLWASAIYRQEMAKVLSLRCIQILVDQEKL